MRRREFLRRGAAGVAGAVITGNLGRGFASVPMRAVLEPTDEWWTRGDYAAVQREVTTSRLEVTGHVPAELDGWYLRNGSNSATQHWFTGDGMIHGVQLGDGGAHSYRNRFVATKLHQTQQTLGATGPPGLDDGYANVSVFHHAGRLLASGEVGLPWELNPNDLSTVGVYDFAGRLKTSMTAHPKIDPSTGFMHFFGYGFEKPYVTYHVADASGMLISSQGVDVGQATMIHDFAITKRDVIFWELPVVFDLAALPSGIPFRWHPEYGARLGVMPLGGPTSAIRWVEIPPCYVFHGVNAFRDGDDVVVDVCRHEKMFDPGVTDSGALTLRRWRVGTGAPRLTFTDKILEDVDPGELPTRDPRRVGRSYRYGYLLQSHTRTKTPVFGGVVKHDFTTGRRESWTPGNGREANEFLFVPTGRDEDHGYLLSYVFDHERRKSDLVILDARDIKGGPVATVHLPVRVPYGFHGTWMAAR